MPSLNLDLGPTDYKLDPTFFLNSKIGSICIQINFIVVNVYIGKCVCPIFICWDQFELGNVDNDLFSNKMEMIYVFVFGLLMENSILIDRRSETCVQEKLSGKKSSRQR